MKEQIRINGVTYNVTSFSICDNHKIVIEFDDFSMISHFLESIQTYPIEMYIGEPGILCGQYYGYKTLYKRDGNKIILSNNGDVWEQEVIEPQPYIPTLEEAKLSKISELRTICHQMIETGVDIEIGDTTQHFSYTTEDQNNIKDAFDLAYQTGLSIPYHADGLSCVLYTPAEITMIFIMNKTNLTHHTTYFNQMKMYVESLDDINTIQLIQYGDPLPGVYFEEYTNMMIQAQLVITALLGPQLDPQDEELEGELLEEEPSSLEEEPLEEKSSEEEISGGE